MTATASSVVHLHEVHSEPDEHLIRLLEEVLEDAKRGEIVSVAIATENRMQCAGSGFSIGAGGDIARLLGSLSALTYKVNKRYHELP